MFAPILVFIYFFIYSFILDNALCSGDHVSWHTPLDYTPSRMSEYSRSPSRIQHILMANDAQLEPITTAMGAVHFMQVIFCFRCH